MGPQASPLELGASPIRFAIRRLRAYPWRMPSKPIELLPEIASRQMRIVKDRGKKSVRISLRKCFCG
jgi:hypothetical protein